MSKSCEIDYLNTLGVGCFSLLPSNLYYPEHFHSCLDYEPVSLLALSFAPFSLPTTPFTLMPSVISYHFPIKVLHLSRINVGHPNDL